MIRLAVRVAREQSELVLAELLELAPAGVEELDVGEGLVEYAVYGFPGELPSLPDVRAAAGAALVDVRTSEVADDWAERWRQFHRPLVLGDALAVRPPWERPTSAAVDLVIDPGRAFGTGAHPSTRLCLELMLELPAAGGFLDVGCGSGVLAIAAAALGWDPVLALDLDAAAVAACRANAAGNAVEVDVRRLDLRIESLPGGFATVAANLLAPLLRELPTRLPAQPDHLIISGLLLDEADAVVCGFGERGLVAQHKRVYGEWAALLLGRE